MNLTVKIVKDEILLRQHFVYQTMGAVEGWYQERGFLILPELVADSYSLVLPKIPWLLEKKYQKAFAGLGHKHDLPDFQKVKYDWLAIEGLEDVWAEIPDCSEKGLQELGERIVKLWDGFWGLDCEQIEIEVLITNLGTRTSFYAWPEKTKLKLGVFLRADASLVYFADALLSMLLILKIERGWENHVELWRARETMAETMLYYSRIGENLDLKKHVKIMEARYGDEFNDIELVKRAVKHLQELGLPGYPEISIDWEQLKTKLSEHEYNLANNLALQKGQVVSYDELAKLLYGDNWEEKFSLEYLAKVVEQVRKKLKKMGYGQMIYTQRGVGYGWW